MKSNCLFYALTLLLLPLIASCASPAQEQFPAAAPPAARQRAAIRITIQELTALFDREFGRAPLIEETLKNNKSFLMVNTKAPSRSKKGSIPGSINIPPSRFAVDIPKLPRDRTIIFYCGGASCPLAEVGAGIAIENGFTDVRVWPECEAAYSRGGNYLIAHTSYVKRLVDNFEQENFVLIDSRPYREYRNEFIPGAISIPWEQFEKKKEKLPRDKNIPLIFYGNGPNSTLSHRSARAAIELGYSRTHVYAAGVSEWKNKGYPLWIRPAGR